jgi:hypothetical protein
MRDNKIMKFRGTHRGPIVVRPTGILEMVIAKSKVSPVKAKYCQIFHRVDGYSYAT